MPKPRVTPRKPLERDIQRQVKHLFTLVGCEVYDTSQGWRKEPGGTRMTPGLADLLVFLPENVPVEYIFEQVPVLASRGVGFFEVKTPDGLKLHHRNLAKWEKRAVAQDRFGTLCRERGVPYAIGGMEQAWAFLASVGLARREQSATGAVTHVNHGYTLTPRRPE